MNAARRVPATLVGLIVIGATLALLAWLPSFLTPRSYRIALPENPSTPETLFPMDRTLPVLWSDGKAVKGKRASLKELAKGHPGGLLVNFWATWCPPCLEELPSLETFGRQLKERGGLARPILVTISVDEKAEEVFRLLPTLGYSVTFPILHDADSGVARTVGSTKYPETFWIGEDGKVRHKWIGPQNWLSREVLQILR